MRLASRDLSHPRFEILDLLGEGGMGRVFRARDRETGRSVALKTLRERTPEDRRRFEEEIRTLGRLHHEVIVELHDLGTLAGELFFAMEYLEGVPLDTFVGGPAPSAAEIRWLLIVALEVLDALGYIHASGALHSDLKPSNVMVLSPAAAGEHGTRPTLAQLAEAGEPRVKLLDFGVARSGDPWRPGSPPGRERRPGGGTPLYMAPEQAAGEPLDGRADLYSLGALLYHLITGEPPHGSLEKALAQRASVRSPRELNPECDEELSALLLALLGREPTRRPSCAEEVGQRLERLVGRSSSTGLSSRPRLVPAAFIGRRAEVDAIRSALAQAASGAGRLLRIQGEGGTGKTWILQRSGLKSDAVLDHGAAFVTARFPRTRTVPPAGALSRAFLALLEVAGNPERHPETERVLGPWAGTFLEALGHPPKHREARTGVNPSSDAPPRVLRERFLETALRLVAAAAARRPLLLAFEDVQNAGELEIEIISRLSRKAPSLPLLLIVTHRGEGSPGSPLGRWLQELDRSGEAPPLRLEALSDGELAMLARRWLRPRGTPSQELLSFLRDRTGGRAGEIGSWLGFLRDEGALMLRDGLWTLVAAPAGREAEDHVAERLESLDAATREILHAVAVIGEAAPSGEIALLLGRPCESELSSLARAGLLVETPEGFELGRWIRPPLLRLPPSRERKLHLGAAELLLSGGGSPLRRSFRLARHFRAAGLADRAVEPLLEAAEEAARIHANLQAAGAYREALELARDSVTRSRIARRLGRLHARTGENQEALEALILAERELSLSDAVAAAGERLDLWDEIGRVLHRRGRLEQAGEYFQRSLRECGADRSRRARCHARLGGIAFDRGDLDRARKHYERAIDLEAPANEPETFIAACSGLGLVEKTEGRGEAAVDRFRAAIGAAESASRLDEAAAILNNLGNLLRAQGRADEAVACLERSIEVRERFGDRQGLAICLNNMARVKGLRGELGAAEDATSQALAIFEEIGDRKGVLITQCNLGELLLLEGRLPEARGHLEETVRLARRSGATRLEKSALLNIARARREEGDPQGGEESLARVLDDATDADATDAGAALRRPALTLLAECLLDQSRIAGAAAALREVGDLGDSALEEATGKAPVDFLAARVRLVRLQGEPGRAKTLGAGALAAVPASADRHGMALLHRQIGVTYRELGPDWADKTEKHLRYALAELEAMGSRHEAAETLAQLGRYWELLGEEEAARQMREVASRTFRLLDLAARAAAVERGEVRS